MIVYFYSMNTAIPSLKTGDTICILAPAKAIDKNYVDVAKKLMENWGLNVVISKHCLGRNNYFSGSIKERSEDFQYALDDENIKAIMCARGGYGCVQIVDLLDWSLFLQSPKWIVGFSDITVLHQRIQQLNLPSIHGTMPLNFKENSEEALETLRQALFGEKYTIELSAHEDNVYGLSAGKLVGGNLSVLYGLLGTNDEVSFENTILFFEDLAEYTYALDRMLYALKKAGIFQQVNGIIVGGMTDMKDTQPTFGKSVNEIMLSHVEELKIPVIFDFPAGHIEDNRALIVGAHVEICVNEKNSSLRYL